jgi:predicted aldo/keto reductase-like oxidoreductase
MDPGEIDAAGQENLEQTIHTALAYGINHIETARGYGTSEMQLGWVLPKIERSSLLVQTKIHPFKDDGRSLRDVFEQSMDYLKLEYVDFLSIHGINHPQHLEACLLRGGPMDEVRELQREGRVRFVGYSTHGGPETAIPAAASGEFDYVNLHWYFVYDPLHWSMVEASRNADMGVFIISPNDKGGMLYNPSAVMKKHCAPMTPMQWHDCYCLQRKEVHTLSLGASKPEDFKEHIEAVCGVFSDAEVDRVTAALHGEMTRRLGETWMKNWHKNLPHHTEMAGGVNVEEILRLWTFEQGLDLLDWAKMRYNLLGSAEHWFPGQQTIAGTKIDLDKVAGHPLINDIPIVLKQAHERYADEEKQTRLSEKDD